MQFEEGERDLVMLVCHSSHPNMDCIWEMVSAGEVLEIEMLTLQCSNTSSRLSGRMEAMR
jgi:hypothetical protein